MLSPMDGNIRPSTPLSSPPRKHQRPNPSTTTPLPSFDKEPHSSPSKLGELGLHVHLSTQPQDPRTETIISVGRSLPFSDDPQIVQTEDSGDNDATELGRLRESMYVTAFNSAVDTVIEREGHLFSPEEMNIINIYRKLPCMIPSHTANLDESMFLYVRLFLRKKSQWFRVDKLGYYSDISNIQTASEHLTLPEISL